MIKKRESQIELVNLKRNFINFLVKRKREKYHPDAELTFKAYEQKNLIH